MLGTGDAIDPRMDPITLATLALLALATLATLATSAVYAYIVGRQHADALARALQWEQATERALCVARAHHYTNVAHVWIRHGRCYQRELVLAHM